MELQSLSATDSNATMSDLYRQMFQQFGQGILVSDLSGRIVTANPRLEAMTGYSLQELTGSDLQSLQLHSDPILRQILHAPQGGWKGEVPVQGKDGGMLSQWLEVSPLGNPHETLEHLLFVYRNLQPAAYQDSLTKLPNRRCFHQCLMNMLTLSHQKHQVFAVLYVDLDRFKFVNDTLGHSFGDDLLQQVADRLKSSLRENDVIARIGGDEFLCLLPDVGKQETEGIAERVLESLSHPFFLHGQEFYTTASMGISLYPFDGDDLETLVSGADAAMYSAKKTGRNLYAWSKAENQAGSFERLVLENNLRRAIDRGQLTIYYQPQLGIEKNQIVGMEALVRWQHPDLGLVSPGDFIPLAEEAGLIIPIDEWVLHTACRQNKVWQQKGYPPLRVAVNLSARHFLQSSLPDKIEDILRETGLDPWWLELEITETAIMQDYQAAVTTLRRLKAMGIHLSIDDFGTGYSSLSYLKALPVDTLKIDRSFIKDISIDKNSKAVTNAIITLAHNLEIKVVAEGVETENQLIHMKEKNCDVIQGFLFSRPVPPERFERLLTQ